jgi:hypothetical protein
LKRLDREYTQLDINNLEKYLNEEEFEEAFGISSFAFRLLKPQDQKALVRSQALPCPHFVFWFVCSCARQLMNHLVLLMP